MTLRILSCSPGSRITLIGVRYGDDLPVTLITSLDNGAPVNAITATLGQFCHQMFFRSDKLGFGRHTLNVTVGLDSGIPFNFHRAGIEEDTSFVTQSGGSDSSGGGGYVQTFSSNLLIAVLLIIS